MFTIVWIIKYFSKTTGKKSKFKLLLSKHSHVEIYLILKQKYKNN